MSIKFIYFDLDDCITDHKRSARKAITDLWEQKIKASTPASISLDDFIKTYESINSKYWALFSDGKVDRDQVKYGRFEDTLKELNITGLNAEKLAHDFLSFVSHSWEWNPNAKETLEALKDYVSMGMITNGFSEVQELKFEHFNLADYADPMIISEDVGVMKPNPGIFNYAAELVGLSADEIMFIGDSLRSDVEGADGVGWKVVWYNPTNQELPEHLKGKNNVYQIQDFNELIPLLKKEELIED